MPRPLSPKDNEMSFKFAQTLTRHERRKLAKINGVKIKGSTEPYIKPKEKKTQYD